jgi:hypothetical protein
VHATIPQFIYFITIASIWIILLIQNFYGTKYAAEVNTINKKTPAMASGIRDHIWTVEEIASLISEQ